MQLAAPTTRQGRDERLRRPLVTLPWPVSDTHARACLHRQIWRLLAFARLAEPFYRPAAGTSSTRAGPNSSPGLQGAAPDWRRRCELAEAGRTPSQRTLCAPNGARFNLQAGQLARLHFNLPAPINCTPLARRPSGRRLCSAGCCLTAAAQPPLLYGTNCCAKESARSRTC